MIKVKHIITYICLTGFFAFLAFPVNADARVKNDYVMVLDTSYSMSGQGGRNIFDTVRSSLNTYVDSLQKGDTLTFITFDSIVKVYPTVAVDDLNDRDIVKKYLSIVEAKGMWTYTQEMIRVVLAKADELQAKDKNRQVVIVIMTDAQDDPPPDKRKDRLSIKDIAKAHGGSDWFIYLVDIGELAQNAKIQKLKGDLSSVSGHTKVIGADKNLNKSMSDVSADIAKKSDELHRPFYTKPLFIAILIALVLLGLFLYYTRLAKLKLSGTLEYWSNDTYHKEVFSADLARFNLRKIAIGKSGDCRISLRDFSNKVPIILEAMSFGGRVRPVIVEALSAPVEFLNGKKTSFLSDGESFIAGSYTFIYREKQG